MTETQYLLGCLAEECAEVAIRASKAQRFGLDEVQPGQGLSNGQRIIEEVNDLFAVLEMLTPHGLSLDGILDKGPVEAKKAKVARFMDYSREQGMLEG
jgi:phosphoribosyl-ATP pyrophosphohydrolase